jgi:predicted AAA+ superfamily ATPase
VLAAARSDPTGLVRALDRTTIDEVQRVPGLFRAIKKSVDEDRRAGRRGWWVIPASSFPVTSSRENLRMFNRCASHAHYSHLSVTLTFQLDRFNARWLLLAQSPLRLM